MKNRQILIVFALLFLFCVIVWSEAYVTSPVKESNILKVSFLDVGQGDSIYIEAPNGRQMIIDGGPNQSILRALPEVMSFGDKSIDVIVVTNPDLDHYSGFIPLLDSYSIGAVLEAGTSSDTSMYKILQEKIEAENVPHIIAEKGERIVLDENKNIYFEILFPDRDVSKWSSNDGSMVGRLIYSDTSVLFTGDSTKLTEGIVVSGSDLSGTDILKVGHHGSSTSTGVPLLEEARPKLAVISAGLNNRYGHPRKDVTDRLTGFGIPYFVTMYDGTINCESDGVSFVCE